MTIEQKQCILKFFGFYAEDIDGIWGPKSVQATIELQNRLGIPDDGIWGPQTDAAARKAVGDGADLLVPEDQKPIVPTVGTFWDHIKYWTREEFRCRCSEYYPEPFCSGFPVEPDQTLVELVDDLRAKAGRPGHRSSGIRCPIHNSRTSRSAANSRHLSGKALDFYIEGLTGAQLLAMAQADKRTRYAYIINQGEPYVHVDVN